MKYYLLSLATALLLACGGSAPAEHNHPEQGHDHATEAAHDHPKGEDHDHQAEKAEHNHAEGITLSVKQATELGLEFTTVEPTTFTGAIRTGGIIEPSTADNSVVAATSSGIVQFSQSGLNIGSPVGNGSKLFTINSEKLTGENLATKVKIAKAELQKAESTYERTRKLREQNLATAPAMDEAELALTTARNTYHTLSRAQVITSPQGGYITSLDVRNGDFVTEGQTLATVSSGKQLVLKADLTARYFDKLSQIASANFTTPYNGQTYSVAELGGKLLSKGQVTAAGTYSIPVRFAIDNRASLIPGSSVEVYLTTAPVKDVIAVPVGAITEEQGTYYVYLKTCTDSYQKQSVTLGQSNGRQVQVLGGLTAGDTVVSRGAYFVRLASKSEAIPHGHSH